MKSHRRILALVALLFGATGLIAQTSTGTGTTTGTGSTTGTTAGGTTTGGSTTGGTTTGGTTTGGTATGGTTTGGTTTNPPPATHGNGNSKASPHTPNEHASDNAKAVQSLLQTFDAKRDQFIADRKALVEKLDAAKTDEERKAILEQLKTEQQARQDERAALGKEIRDEIKKLREQRKNGGG